MADKSPPEQRKRYKHCLTPEYDPRNVSSHTRKLWEIRAKKVVTALKEKKKITADVWDSASKTSPSAAGLSSSVQYVLATDTDNDITFDTDPTTNNMGNNRHSDKGSLAADDSDNSSEISTNEDAAANQSIENCVSEFPIYQRSENEKNREREPDSHIYNSDDVIMFEASHLTIRDVQLMVQCFCLRHGVSDNARMALIDMFKICAGPKFENVQISKHKFDKIFEVPQEKITKHYYCDICSTEIHCSSLASEKKLRGAAIQRTQMCHNCEKEHVINSNNNYNFLTINIEYQLSQFLKKKNILSAIRSNLCSNRDIGISTRNISDYCDGELYSERKDHSKQIFFNFSTDGAPIFHKSKKSMWPLQIVLNNLPPQLRYQNVIIVALMIVEKEPSPELMNTFLKTFVNEMNRLSDQGILLDLQNNGSLEVVKIATLCCSVDSVARPVCQNRLQFNGYFGCSFCYVKGEHCGQMVYPFGPVNDELRTHESHLSDLAAVEVHSSTLKSRGVKGRSILLELDSFDIVWGFAFDTMHTAELGVTKYLWESFSKKNKNKIIRSINSLLTKIKPPHDIGTLPKDLTDMKNYKAKDWRSFLLFFSVPLLHKHLPESEITLLVFFAKSMYLLYQTSISRDDLDICEELLLKFVAKFEALYGKTSMRFNVHMLLHAVDSVRKCGPLWVNSTYPYESNIHFLKKKINGSKSVDLQVINKSMKVTSCQIAAGGGQPTFRRINCYVQAFCENLFVKDHHWNGLKIGDVTYFNSCNRYTPTGINDDLFFKKCIHRGVIYTSDRYDRTEKWDDCCIQLCSGLVGVIRDIKVSNEKCIFIVNLCTLEDFTVHGITLPHIFRVTHLSIDVFEISLQDILSKVVIIFNENNMFVAKIPNALFNI